MTEWKGVVTNSGLTAFDLSFSSGQALNINAVAIGTGYVAEANMRTQTALQTPVGTGSVLKKTAVDNGIQVLVGFGALNSQATIHELGIYGTVNGVSYLLALYQNEDGIKVPSVADFPAFSYRLSGTWNLDNTDNITVTIDPGALMTMDDLADGLATCVALDQGSANEGKFLTVGSDGNVTLVTLPYAEEEDF